MKAAGREEAPPAFPWDEAMALAFGVLRLSPRDFWGMTPRELERALSVLAAPAGGRPSREGLEAMMRAFPD